MLQVITLVTGGMLALLLADRKLLREVRRFERWLYLGVMLVCYGIIMADLLFPHAFALSPPLERLITGLFPQAAG